MTQADLTSTSEGGPSDAGLGIFRIIVWLQRRSADEYGAYRVGRWYFLRLVGLIHVAAFASLWVQIIGLVGEQGILPAGRFLQGVHEALGGAAYWQLPTLGLLGAGDAALRAMCLGGMVCGAAVVAGFAQPLFLGCCWVLFLGLVHLGQNFLSFQWDILLLETTLLAILCAPMRIRPAFSRETAMSPVVRWLLWWLLFRLMFSSGIVKLGDPTWTRLDALAFHYETQPLPTPVAWYVHQLPGGFHAASTAIMFLIEIAAPFCIFLPRRLRHAGAALLMSLQVLIMLTGNYTYFNWLTLALCLLLFDDPAWRWAADRLRSFHRRSGAETASPKEKSDDTIAPVKPVFLWFHLAAGVFLFYLSLTWISMLFTRAEVVPGGQALLRVTRPFFLVNTYGLFAHMTTERDGIVIEGSNDGEEWRAYEFRYKPGALDARPRVAPHQPRLDWQMWFAALGSPRQNVWFIHLMHRLLEGSNEVLGLFASNPFPEGPPQYVRARFYQYHFTSWAEGRESGDWWKREDKGLYVPAASLDDFEGRR